MSSLKARFAKGLGWGLIDNFSGTGVNFIVGILLARQLSPEIFGIVGVALVLVSVANTIADAGFSNALIRKTEVSPIDYSTTFLLNMAIAIGIYLLLFLSAPYIAAYYKIGLLIPVVRLISLSVLFAAFAVSVKARLTRQMDFRTQAVASMLSSLVSATVGLYMVYHGWGIWSLVAQQLLRQSLYAVSLSVAARYVPRIAYSSASAHELFSFGSRILLSSLLTTVYNNLYYMVVGKVYTPRQLGLYTRAEQFSLMIALNFTLVLQRVSLPALTNSKSCQGSFDSAFQRLYKFSALLGSLFLFSLAAMADNFTYVLVGHQWIDSAPILRILSIYAAFPPIIALHQNILQVFGKSRLFLSLEAIKTLISTIIVAATIFLSFYALLWGVVFIGIISLAINGYWGSKYLSTYTQSKQLRDTLFYFLISAVVALLVYFSSFLLTSHVCKLGIQLSVFSVSSLLLFVFILKDERRALTQILRPSSKTQINNE
jgi:O-antigen repeat unit transporter